MLASAEPQKLQGFDSREIDDRGRGAIHQSVVTLLGTEYLKKTPLAAISDSSAASGGPWVPPLRWNADWLARVQTTMDAMSLCVHSS